MTTRTRHRRAGLPRGHHRRLGGWIGYCPSTFLPHARNAAVQRFVVGHRFARCRRRLSISALGHLLPAAVAVGTRGVRALEAKSPPPLASQNNPRQLSPPHAPSIGTTFPSAVKPRSAASSASSFAARAA